MLAVILTGIRDTARTPGPDNAPQPPQVMEPRRAAVPRTSRVPIEPTGTILALLPDATPRRTLLGAAKAVPLLGIGTGTEANRA